MLYRILPSYDLRRKLREHAKSVRDARGVKAGE